MADKGKFAAWGNRVGGSQLAAVITKWNPTSGLPSNPESGDRYIASATANGWTNKRIYTWTGIWNETIPAANAEVFLSQDGVYAIYEGGVWKTLASHTQAGRNGFVASTPDPRACEWNGSAVRGTIRRGRKAWARARVAY